MRCLSLLALLVPGPALAQEADPLPPVSLEQRMLLRCSAAFSIIAGRQDHGDEEAQQYPPLAERGMEFFVQSSAQVMDGTGMDIDQLAQALEREGLQMLEDDELDAIMPVCLQLLDQSGL